MLLTAGLGRLAHTTISRRRESKLIESAFAPSVPVADGPQAVEWLMGRKLWQERVNLIARLMEPPGNFSVCSLNTSHLTSKLLRAAFTGSTPS